MIKRNRQFSRCCISFAEHVDQGAHGSAVGWRALAGSGGILAGATGSGGSGAGSVEHPAPSSISSPTVIVSAGARLACNMVSLLLCRLAGGLDGALGGLGLGGAPGGFSA